MIAPVTAPPDSGYAGAMTALIPLLLVTLAVIVWQLIAARRGLHALRLSSREIENDQLDALVARLARAAGVARVRVRLLEQPNINGLATLGGDIYLTRGLFQAFQTGRVNGAELASVVAHEMGHLALGHTRRRMIDVLGAHTAHVVLGAVLARFVPYFGWVLSGRLARLFVARLSRQDEFEADAYATALMLKAGLGAEPQARMLEKLLTLAPESGGGWLASHPPVPDRARAIRDNARRWAPKLVT